MSGRPCALHLNWVKIRRLPESLRRFYGALQKYGGRSIVELLQTCCGRNPDGAIRVNQHLTSLAKSMDSRSCPVSAGAHCQPQHRYSHALLSLMTTAGRITHISDDVCPLLGSMRLGSTMLPRHSAKHGPHSNNAYPVLPPGQAFVDVKRNRMDNPEQERCTQFSRLVNCIACHPRSPQLECVGQSRAVSYGILTGWVGVD